MLPEIEERYIASLFKPKKLSVHRAGRPKVGVIRREYDFKGIRTALGLTKVAIAKKIGITARTYGVWESGQSVPNPVWYSVLDGFAAQAATAPPMPQKRKRGAIRKN